jgi:hypothetical protein
MKRHVESPTSEEEEHHAIPQVHKRVKPSPQDAAKLLILSLSFGSQNNDRDQQRRKHLDTFNELQAIVSDDEEEEDEHEAPAARLTLPVAPTDWRLIFRPLSLPPRLPSVPKGFMIIKNQMCPRLELVGEDC